MRKKILVPALTAMGVCLSIAACSEDPATDPASEPAGDTPDAVEAPGLVRTPAPDGAEVFFITPADGDAVGNPVTIEFGIRGMSVVKAGVDEPASGHHHLIIDADLPDPGMPIPADDHHIHFGDASTSTEMTLEPGPHTLQLLLGDHLHIPHDPPVASERITITVE